MPVADIPGLLSYTNCLRLYTNKRLNTNKVKYRPAVRHHAAVSMSTAGHLRCFVHSMLSTRCPGLPVTVWRQQKITGTVSLAASVVDLSAVKPG
jgi:hypothetical protein